MSKDIMKVSCMDSGKQIFGAEIPADTPDEKKLWITSAYPQAMCVFLKTKKQIKGTSIAGEAVPNLKDAAPNDLAKALSYLSGEGEIGQPYGSDFDSGMKTYSKTYNAFPMDNNTINLTIGIYENAKQEDVLKFWGYLKKNTEILGSMTPTIEILDSIAILSVEGVLDTDANQVCQEAKEYASGCIATY